MEEVSIKIQNREACAKLIAEAKSRGQRVGFTSGSFDLIHPGHALYLKEAKKHCDLLVVGVNSDRSVQTYKSKLRPVMPEQDRLVVLSALESVDLVFLFDEINNNSNIEVLKPDVYIKAGDYDKAALSSAPLVESYGGEVLLVPFEKGHSTSSIIARVVELSKAQSAGCFELELPPRRPAVFIDRDGTIAQHVEYLHEPEKLRVLPGALEAIKGLQQAGFRIVIITNQPGIGLGFYSKEDFYRVNLELLRAASKAGVLIDKVYFCPHSKAEQCLCRKPGTALVERACKELNLDLPGSYVIGDMTIDLMLAKNAGCTPVLVKTGYGGKDGFYPAEPAFTGNDLAQAAEWILEHSKTELLRLCSNETVDAEETPPELQDDSARLEAIGKVTGKLGHDFNNLLGAISGCIDLMKNKIKASNDPDLFARQIRIMESSLQKTLFLTGKMRGFVRPGPLYKTNISLLASIHTVIELLHETQTKPFEVCLEAGSDFIVEASEFQVVQMLMALCLNAIDAMRQIDERFLVLRLEEVELAAGQSADLPPGQYAHLAIIDHGEGMPAEIKARIFKPFFTTKSGEIGQGMGLGLAMAREIMHRHQGGIEIASIPECGTAVHLYFPLLTPSD